jgi:hypothetical protein
MISITASGLEITITCIVTINLAGTKISQLRHSIALSCPTLYSCDNQIEVFATFHLFVHTKLRVCITSSVSLIGLIHKNVMCKFSGNVCR